MTLLYPYAWVLFPLYLLCEALCQPRLETYLFSNYRMLRQAAGSGADIQRILRFLIVLCMVAALSTPVLKQQTTTVAHQGHDISLLLDASDSMKEDQRFVHAKEIIGSFIKRRKGDRIALSLFADHAYLSVPFTTDTTSISTVLSHLEVGMAGRRHTALYEALFLGSKLFAHSKAKEKIVILLTDGLNTVQSVPLEVALEEAKKAAIKVYTIGLGDDYQKEVLEQISHKTGGTFYEASHPASLQHIYDEINRLEKSRFDTETFTRYTHLFRYPVALALLLSLLLFWIRFRRERTHAGYWQQIPLLLLLGYALYGPYQSIQRHDTQKAPPTLIVGLDLSRSMGCSDIYPSREALAQNRIAALISLLPGSRIGLMGYATQAYLIAPPTQEHKALQQLLQGIDTRHISTKGTYLMALLRDAYALLKHQQKRTVVLFTDGGAQQTFDKEIAYAKKRHMTLFVYAIGSTKGGTLKQGKGFLLNQEGDIVITRLNPKIKTLATKTRGAYIRHQASDQPIKALAETLLRPRTNISLLTQESVGRRELFYLPLLLALLYLLWMHRRWRRSS